MSEDLETIVARTLGIDRAAVDDRLAREREPAWDSFNHLLLIAEVERAYGIRFAVDQPAAIHDLPGLRAAVAALTGRP